jgi:hypothetical protein
MSQIADQEARRRRLQQVGQSDSGEQACHKKKINPQARRSRSTQTAG